MKNANNFKGGRKILLGLSLPLRDPGCWGFDSFENPGKRLRDPKGLKALKAWQISGSWQLQPRCLGANSCKQQLPTLHCDIMITIGLYIMRKGTKTRSMESRSLQAPSTCPHLRSAHVRPTLALVCPKDSGKRHQK